MDTRLVDQRIHCPFCGESMTIVIDLSAGGQSYIEDCQVCCQPMQIRYEVDHEDLDGLRVGRAS